MGYNTYVIGVMLVFALGFAFGAGLTWFLVEIVVDEQPVTLTCTTEIPERPNEQVTIPDDPMRFI